MVKAPGELCTAIPSRAAAARSMESIPVPHFEMTFRRGAARSTCSVNWSSPQMTPSMSPTHSSNSAALIRSRTGGTTISTLLSANSCWKRSSTGDCM